MKDNNLKGYFYAILSAATFGSIPLFSVPVLNAGFPLPSVLIYRYVFGCIFMLTAVLARRGNLRITWREFVDLAFLSSLYVVSSICLMTGYNYMPSGIATTLLFSYPVWTQLLLVLFFHEKLTLKTSLAIILAVLGVAFLGGVFEAGGKVSVIGVALELASGFMYAIYMVTFQQMRIRRLSALKVNFYIFLIAILLLSFYSVGMTGSIARIPNAETFAFIMLLGLVPTTISNLSLVRALTYTSSSNVAILGAFEPFTAIIIGCFLLNEPMTVSIIIGFILILCSVVTLIVHGNRFLSYHKISSLVFHLRHAKRFKNIRNIRY